ncbi:hypothetical protein GCM10027416_22940 [Okibacterium endophyticum]
MQTESGAYAPGPALSRIAMNATAWSGLEPTAQRLVDRLHNEIDETCLFFVRTGTETLCIASRESSKPVRRVCPRGYVGQLHVGAAGKALLAFEDPNASWLVAFLESLGGFRLASGEMKTTTQLLDDLKRIRLDGYAISFRESTEESWSVAVPVFFERELTGVLVAAVPTSRCSDDYVRTVRDAATAVASEHSR